MNVLKGTLLASALFVDVARGVPLSASVRTPTAAPNLIVNGTFDTDTTGWSIVAGTQAATAGRMRLTAGAVAPKSEQTFNTEVGRTYRVTYDAFTGTTATGTRVAIRDSSGATITTDDTEGLGVTWTFVATTTTTTIRLTTPSAPGSGLYVEFDNISIVAL